MKRNTTLTLMMMLSSVAAAVAAPDMQPHEAATGCSEFQQVAAVVDPDVKWQRRTAVKPGAVRNIVNGPRKPVECIDDITAPYRRLHDGGLKSPAVCSSAT